MGNPIIIELRKKSLTSFDGDDQLRYLKSHIQAVDGLLDANGNIDMALIPNELKYGLKQVASATYIYGTQDTFLYILSQLNARTNNDPQVGNFLIIDVGGEFIVNENHIVVNGDDGGGEIIGTASPVETIILEKNDWLIYKGMNGTDHLWSVVNNTYDLATLNHAGLMSASDKLRLGNMEDGANNYIHPTNGANATLTGGNISFISSLEVNSLGHVLNMSLGTIRYGNEFEYGVMVLAARTEIRTSGLNADKPISEARAMDAMHYNELIKTYDTVAEADASSAHGPNSFVFIKVGTVSI